jgi:hypothetical protein
LSRRKARGLKGTAIKGLSDVAISESSIGTGDSFVLCDTWQPWNFHYVHDWLWKPLGISLFREHFLKGGQSS